MPESSAASTTRAVACASIRQPKLLHPRPITVTSRDPIRRVFMLTVRCRLVSVGYVSVQVTAPEPAALRQSELPERPPEGYQAGRKQVEPPSESQAAPAQTRERLPDTGLR